ncbi:hypothetical protein [uncultured Sphingomonas sp.]|uniref:hypothetical protein n=1 Tax=uncultured Sphingomonas sp. TaxID=158754 RepID=UPI0035CB3882
MTALRNRLLIGAIAAAAVAVPSQLAAQTLVPSATITAGGGYSTNPFLGRGDGDGAASAQVSITPRLEILDDTDSGVVSGYYNRTEYFKNFDANDSYGLTIGGNSQLNPRASIGFSAGYDSSILGAAGAYSGVPIFVPGTVGGTVGTGAGVGPIGVGTGDPGTVGVTPVPTTPLPLAPVFTDPGAPGGDIGLIGLRQRRNSLTASVFGSYRPDEVSTWGLGANVSRNSYPDSGGVAISSRTYGVNTSYTRSLSERSSIGLQVSATVIDYADVPNSRFINPMVTYSTQLAQNWSLNLGVGVSLVDDGFSNGVAASANGSLCRAIERGSFCLIAARQPSVSAFGGARNQTSVSANYSYRLAERTSISATASYQRSSNGIAVSQNAIARSNQDFISASATVNQQIARRLSAFATALYRDVKGLGVPTDGDIGGRVGLALTVGGRQ